MLLVAVALYFFMMPSDIVLGSIAGLSVVLIHFVPVSMSVMTLCLNILCLILGFLFVGREFGGKTVYSSLLLPLYLNILERLFPANASLTGDMVLDTLCTILILSIGQAMMFHANASSGGLDIIAKILNKYFHIELGQGVAVIGMLTVLSSILVYDSKTLIVGILGTYFNGIVLDAYIGGFSRRKRVCILSNDTDVITDYILNTLERGVTLYNAHGAYGKKEHREIVTILTNSEYGKLMEYIHLEHPQAFVTVSTVNEVVGVWRNRSSKKKN